MITRRFAPLAVAMMLAATLPAGAGPTIIDGTYSETGVDNCGGAGNGGKCLIDTFTLVPTGKIVTITRVSCWIAASKENTITQVFIGRHMGTPGTGSVAIPQYIVPTKTGEGSVLAWYHINSEVNLALARNMRPAVQAQATGTPSFFQLSCTVTGRRTDAI